MALVLGSAPASALDVNRTDHGGRVDRYAARLAAANARDEPIRIGAVDCDSSCTLFLSARRACVSPRAVLGFHAPWFGSKTRGVLDPQMTAFFAQSYKPPLRRVFLNHVRDTGYAAPGPLLHISGAQLARMGYNLCRE
jgi:hypothetical protein